MKQLVCTCGWKSELYPDGTMFAGPGGQLSCPDCARAERNRNIEVFGSVKVVTLQPIRGWHQNHNRIRLFLAHYYVDGKSLCKRYTYSGDDYTTEETMETLNKMRSYYDAEYKLLIRKCPICERRKKLESNVS